MGIFGNSSPFDEDVEKATNENNTSEEWGLILEICDKAAASQTASKDCLRSIIKRLQHPDPHVQVHAITLLAACVNNCGKTFHLEIASRDFETEFRRILARVSGPVAQQLRLLLKSWAEGEFKSDPQLDLIPSLYAKLRAEGASFSDPSTKSKPKTDVSAEMREQDELARAIALSLKESGAQSSSHTSSSLYPSVSGAPPAPPAPPAPAPTAAPPAVQKVRALYDFEAAEDNELTFMAGEIVHVTDSSDPNWWKGYNERGEGLFPANFISTDLNATVYLPYPVGEHGRSKGGKSVQWAVQEERSTASTTRGEQREDREQREERGEVCEEVMDRALRSLHDANPEDPDHDSSEMLQLERRVYAMSPAIDAQLEVADRRHARLTALSAELVEALNLYHHLMRGPLYAPTGPPVLQGHPQMPPTHPQHPRC